MSEHVDIAEAAPSVTTDVTPVPTTTPVGTEGTEESDGGAGGKVKAAALLAGAAALANKVRQEAPKKVQEIREKRVAGRCVILTELGGREVAVGPYPDERAARQDTVSLRGGARVIELMSQTSYRGTTET